jgi:hypothetical protein
MKSMSMKEKSEGIILALLLLTHVLSGSGWALEPVTEKKSIQTLSEKAPYSPYVERTYATDVYWGDTHVHTKYSFDAGLFGNYKLGPEEAYKFARGEEVMSNSGMSVRLSRPLDFLVVSDHAEFLGLFPTLQKLDPELLTDERTKRLANLLKAGPPQSPEPIVRLLKGMVLKGGNAQKDNETRIRSAWKYITEVADTYNDPGKFSAFIGYEWSPAPGSDNLHRNVIFKDDGSKANQVIPFSATDSADPEDLWRFMSDYEKKTGGQVLAIPHNANLSNGMMFAVEDFKGNAITKEYAEQRVRWEPVVEVTQIKGDGETHPFLSPDDEFADYETWDKGNLFQIAPKNKSMLQYEYARSALKLGLMLEKKIGANPFKFGMIGSTDSHTSLSTAQEDNFWGKTVASEPRGIRYSNIFFESEGDEKQTTYGWQIAASGLAAVWARENTREALFEAMRRKEIYATTGPRMSVRLFGGWGFRPEDASAPNLAETGYRKGVPMGGDLTGSPTGKAPRFLVAALKDPIGANLDRIQIIKGWLDEKGELHEKVYNAVLSDGRKVGRDGNVKLVGNTVDVRNAAYTNSIGDAELRTVWEDPEFDPGQSACYYARVLEIPTPRWTAFDAKYFGVEMPEDVPMTTQERAYTSPIWFTPVGVN